MYRQNNLLHNLDWITIGLYLLLVLLGWLNIYAAVYNENHSSILSFSQNYGKQLIWIGSSLGLAFICLSLDTKFYSVFAYILYGVMVALLLGVLVFGEYSHGARSWYNLGSGIKMQPSEFAKMATALAVARFLSSRHGTRVITFKNVLIAAALILLPPCLIILQPDMGSCLVYVSFILVLYREGLPGIYLGCGLLAVALFILSFVANPAVLVGLVVLMGIILYSIHERQFKPVMIGLVLCLFIVVLCISLNESMFLGYELATAMTAGTVLSCIILLIIAYFTHHRKAFLPILLVVGSLCFISSIDFIFNKLDTHQQERIEIMMGLREDPYGVGYNVNQSLIAIGSGGFSGKGFLQGTQTKYDFVPEQSTDFIFCTVGEEWGFLGSSFVVCLLIVFILRILFLAERQRSAFSRIYGYCVVSILSFHVMINIGMTLGLLPVIGIPLPFFSYGGSSLWAFSILIFIMIRLDASRREYFC